MTANIKTPINQDNGSRVQADIFLKQFNCSTDEQTSIVTGPDRPKDG